MIVMYELVGKRLIVIKSNVFRSSIASLEATVSITNINDNLLVIGFGFEFE